ncbi:MAG: beta-ketoacyl synthase [Flavobacteriales bacterium]|nr:beta-ketoacyl synthase [Flavobacteriales bacterium]
MKLYLGGTACVTPLGADLVTTYEAMEQGRTGIRTRPNRLLGRDFHVGAVGSPVREDLPRIDALIDEALKGVSLQIPAEVFHAERTRWIIATTKGDIHSLERDEQGPFPLPNLADRIGKRYRAYHPPLVVSNACISGTLAMIMAADQIALGLCDHAIIIGADVISDFVLSGFHALHAMADGPCTPFDDGRTGITLGEAAACAVLSKDHSLFDRPVAEYLGGGLGSDANHISGPSRTGEGSVRAIRNAMAQACVQSEEITHVNAHGTGSLYNDTMEAIALDRSGLAGVPLNSYKGFFGHTLGAAGLLEGLIAVHGLQRGRLLRSLGAQDTSEMPSMDVLKENRATSGTLLLKTSSGFGGCNAAVILRALN